MCVCWKPTTYIPIYKYIREATRICSRGKRGFARRRTQELHNPSSTTPTTSATLPRPAPFPSTTQLLKTHNRYLGIYTTGICFRVAISIRDESHSRCARGRRARETKLASTNRWYRYLTANVNSLFAGSNQENDNTQREREHHQAAVIYSEKRSSYDNSGIPYQHTAALCLSLVRIKQGIDNTQREHHQGARRSGAATAAVYCCCCTSTRLCLSFGRTPLVRGIARASAYTSAA